MMSGVRLLAPNGNLFQIPDSAVASADFCQVACCEFCEFALIRTPLTNLCREQPHS